MTDKILKLESEYTIVTENFLSILNYELKDFEKKVNIINENFAYDLSRQILTDLQEKYDIKLDVSIINNGLIKDFNKVIESYNKKYTENLINYNFIEDVILSDDDNKEKCKKIDDYFRNIKQTYLMEKNFINTLNETFAKRVLNRIIKAQIEIAENKKDDVLNSILSNIAAESNGIVNNINQEYINNLAKINSIVKKYSEATAQLSMLQKYKRQENEEELEYTSRISRLRAMMELEKLDEETGEIYE